MEMFKQGCILKLNSLFSKCFCGEEATKDIKRNQSRAKIERTVNTNVKWQLWKFCND